LSQRETIEVMFNVSQVLFGGLAESFSPEYLSIVLKRKPAPAPAGDGNAKWSWVTGPSVTIPYHFGRQIPKLCIEDNSDRFYCLLDLCDRSRWTQQVIERLHISTEDGNECQEKERKDVQHQPGAAPSRLHLTSTRGSPPDLSKAIGMEMYSSKLGNILNTLLTRVNLYRFKHADINQLQGPEELSFIQRVLVLVFIHFPVNDFALNPWDLAEIISQSTLADSTYTEDSRKDYTRLQLDMRYLCTRFEVPGSMLETYLEHVLTYDIVSPFKDDEVDDDTIPMTTPFAVLLPHIDSLLSFGSLQLLSAGSALLRWDFLRAVRCNYRNAFNADKARPEQRNPFMDDIVLPFPTHRIYAYRHKELTISKRGLRNWVALHGLNIDTCERLFDAVTALLDTPFMTFSAFVIVAVLGYCDAHGSYSRENMLHAIGAWLESINTDMDAVQKQQCPSICSCALDEILASSNTIEEKESAMVEVTTRSLAYYNDQCSSRVVKVLTRSGKRDTSLEADAVDLPPRPPPALWDAPRFVHYCKCMGVLGVVSTLSATWNAFARIIEESYLPSQRQGWDTSVIPPLPVQVNSSVIAKLLGDVVIGSVYTESDKEGRSQLPKHHTILLTSVVPLLIGCADDAVAKAAISGQDLSSSLASSQSTSAKRDKNPLLDDLLRYGGSRVMAALDRFYPWIVGMYSELAETDHFDNENGREPLLRNVCQFMSQSKIFGLGPMSVLMKASLSPRVRGSPPLSPAYTTPTPIQQSSSSPNSKTPGRRSTAPAPTLGQDIGVSLPEFEELLIRCAYSLWRKAGVVDVKDIGSQEFFRCIKAALPTLDDMMVSVYCEECRLSLAQYRSNAPVMKARYDHSKSNSRALNQDFRLSSRPGGKTWGLDFVYPFCALLEVATHDLLVKLRPAVPSPPPSEVKRLEDASSHSSPMADTHHRLSQEGPKASPRPNPTPTPSDVQNILVTVESKSEEVLANILALRDAAVSASKDSAEDLVFGDGYSEDGEVVVKDTDDERSHPSDSSPAGKGGAKQEETLQHLTPVKPMRPTATEGAGSFVGTPHADLPNKRHTPSPHRIQNIKILEGTKEALWPVFATYCSCGDSSDPGKLSGPNLFALLSKLDLLTNDTTIPDLGILLHQISAHSLAQSSSVVSLLKNEKSGDDMSPLLSFEEFLVFLCVFAELRFEGTINIPLLTANAAAIESMQSQASSIEGDVFEDWFDMWSEYMIKSSMFRRLLEDCVLPPLQKSLVLASPEGARHRDEFRMLFSLEILFGIETIERAMLVGFDSDLRRLQHLQEDQQDPIVQCLSRIKIVPQIVSEAEVMQLIADILPKSALLRSKSVRAGSYPYRRSGITFPQWQWVICVIAFKAVIASIRMSESHEPVEVSIYSSLCACAV
jgi:hypothetical protein